jgi:hypothetical protein
MTNSKKKGSRKDDDDLEFKSSGIVNSIAFDIVGRGYG